MGDAPLELICPAGTPAALRAAVDAGADAVYLGFRNATNARNFPGLNFSREELKQGLAYAHDRNAKVFVAVNTFPEAGNAAPWRQAVADAATLGADAVILADIGLADYAARNHPDLRRHLSVQASASTAEAILFYHREFDIKRVILPRVLTVPEMAALNRQIPVETEVFVFGAMGVMAEGRCLLSSYVTGLSPNLCGMCSPPSHVRFIDQGAELVAKLGDYTIDVYAGEATAGYPTLCRGRFLANGRASYLFEEPTSLNALDMLPELMAAGVTALKIEGRQRGRAYISKVVAGFRRAVDALARGEPMPVPDLTDLSEGGQQTTGGYSRNWH